MNFTFLASDVRPYHGVTRALLGLAAALVRSGDEVNVLVRGDCRSIEQYLLEEERVTSSVKSFASNSQLLEEILKLNTQHFVTDDYLPNLVLSEKVSKLTGCKRIVYALVFNGLSLLGHSDAEGARLGGAKRVARFLPWRIVTREYRRQLSACHKVIVPSYYAESLLFDLYGIRFTRVVRPILAPSFRVNVPAKSNSKVVLLFAGSNQEDISSTKLRLALENECSRMGFKLAIFGTVSSKQQIQATEILSPDSDRELADLYRSSSSVVIPQLWEAFGYVGVEAIACLSRPVVLRYQPWMEILCGDMSSVAILDSLSIEESVSHVLNTPVKEEVLKRSADRLKHILSPELSAAKFKDAVDEIQTQ